MRPSTRARIGFAAVFGLGLTAGIVVFARIGRSRAQDPLKSTGTAPVYTPQGKPMPPGCDVDSADPPVLPFADLPGNRLSVGALRQGEKLMRTVTVRNTGGGVLCVRDIETGCGCVKADWEGDRHIASGASGTLSLRIDTTDKDGVQDKWVTLYTNDPKVRHGAVMTVALDISLGLVVVAPPGGPATLLALGTHPPGESATATLRLRCPKDERVWAILGVESAALPESSRSKFTWSIERVEPTDIRFRQYDLRITHPGRAEPGRDSQLLLIKTSHADRPEIRLDAELTVSAK